MITFHENAIEDSKAIAVIKRQLEFVGADVEPLTMNSKKMALAFTLPETMGARSIRNVVSPNKTEAPCHYFVTEISPFAYDTTLEGARWIGQQMNLPPELRNVKDNT